MADMTDDSKKTVTTILKVSGSPGTGNERKDTHGNSISRGSKGYKISFNPQLEKVWNRCELTQVVEVESYKVYNSNEYEDEHKSKCCSIF